MKKYLFIIITLLLFPVVVQAQEGTININTSNKNITTGDNITININIESKTAIGYYEYTLDYDNTKLKLLNGNPYTMDKPNANNTKKITKSYKFKVLKTGKTKVSVKSYVVTSYEKEQNINIKINPLTINTSKNNNTSSNYLSSLEVEGYKISPSFSKENTDYTLKINKDIDSINIIATPENKNVTIEGTGKRTLTPGENKLDITVKNNKDEELTYSILITVNDENSIKITIEGQEYTLLKNISNIDIPEGYKTIKLNINDVTIKALYSDITKYTLVGLKDEEGNIKLYIYDQDTDSYIPYNEITLKEIKFLPIKTNDTLKEYQKYNETINDIDIECLKISSYSNYCIIYGMNLNTGEKGWYSYNKKEETIQKYNTDIEDHYKEKINSTKTLIYILSATTLIFGISTIILAIKKSKRKWAKTHFFILHKSLILQVSHLGFLEVQ